MSGNVAWGWAPAEQGFLEDLRSSFRILRSSPLLVALVLAVFALPVLVPTSAPVGLLWPVLFVTLFGLGVVGTIRVWFLRAGRHEPSPDIREAWSLSWGFVLRFLRLYLLTVPVVAVVVGQAADSPRAHEWALIPAAFVLDCLLTFVFPTLALETKQVRRALPAGFRMIRATWPSGAPYVLVPGVTVVLVARGVGQLLLGSAMAFPVETLAALLMLWFDGAITLFFVRWRQAERLSTPPAGETLPER